MKKNGYTLVELLVSITIITTLFVITVANLRGGNDNQALLRSAQELAFNLRKVQNLSLSTKKYGVNSVCFYGLKIDTANSYFLYYNDTAGCSGPVMYVGDFATKIDPNPIYLEKGIEFSPTSVGKDIAFVPPEPLTYYMNSNNFAPQNIVLRIKSDIATTKIITVNRLGNIQIQ